MKKTQKIYKNILQIIVLVLIAFVTEECVRTMLNGFWFSVLPYCDDVEYYKNESYKNFWHGKEASEYLPQYNEIDNAEHIEFLYTIESPAETIFIDCSDAIVVAVCYEKDTYYAEKEKLMQQGTEMGGVSYFSQTRLVKTVRKGIKQKMHYLTLLSDECCTVFYLVYYDDVPLEDIHSLFAQSDTLDYFMSKFFMNFRN